MKKRLDILLTERNLVPSRNRAQAFIMKGVVFVEGQREDKPGSTFSEDVHIEIKEDPIPFVSRGGLKIQKALDEFGIDLDGLVTMDVGASTGGFTDCMLKRGALRVYSVDVGYGQLDYGLRNDDRVVVMERTNIRKMDPAVLDPVPEFVSIDVSFISLRLVIPVVKNMITEPKRILALIKPQFEAGRESVGKNGVVRDPNIHCTVIEEIVRFVEKEGFCVKGLSYSPIKGPKGNIEYLMYIENAGVDHIPTDIRVIRSLVDRSHMEMDGKHE